VGELEASLILPAAPTSVVFPKGLRKPYAKKNKGIPIMGRFALLALIGIWVFAPPSQAQFAQAPVYEDTTSSTAAGQLALTTEIGAENAQGCGSFDCGADNTAFGGSALQPNQDGSDNSAFGYGGLGSNVHGNGNSAFGSYSLESNTGTNYNSAFGFLTLTLNTASGNTAVGAEALYASTSGNYNTAIGYGALSGNSNGTENSALGADALNGNTNGNFNVAAGASALLKNTTGNANLAFGLQALYSNTTGSNNIGVGYAGGYSLTTGSNNIDIGNVGVRGESGAIRIGTTSKQTSAYIAGIYGKPVTGSAVMISSTGQLGVVTSSERFKTAVEPMGSRSAKLAQLRPVSFHLKSDPQGALQYGLIAEEVARVYPELVIRSEHGRIDGVRYDELAPMLLNEMNLKLKEQDEKLRAQNEALTAQIRELGAAVLKLQKSQHP